MFYRDDPPRPLVSERAKSVAGWPAASLENRTKLRNNTLRSAPPSSPSVEQTGEGDGYRGSVILVIQGRITLV